MLFLIKYFIRLLIFIVILTLLLETALALYSQYQLTPTTFWPSFFTHFSQEINHIIDRIASLELQDLLVVEWGLWLFQTKPYYLVLILLICVGYFKLRRSTLKQPLLVKQPKLPLDRYEQQKKQNTERELKKLKQSYDYKKLKRDIYLHGLPQKEDDEVVAELRQKQAELF